MVCWSGRGESLVRVDAREDGKGESCISKRSEGFQGVDSKDSLNNPNVAAKTQVIGRG